MTKLDRRAELVRRTFVGQNKGDARIAPYWLKWRSRTWHPVMQHNALQYMNHCYYFINRSAGGEYIYIYTIIDAACAS